MLSCLPTVWFTAVSRVSKRVRKVVEHCNKYFPTNVATMNSHVSYGLHYPYNYVGAGLMSPTGAPFFSGGGLNYRPPLRTSPRPPYNNYHRSHNDKAQALAYAALYNQFVNNFVFNNSEIFHPQCHTSRHHHHHHHHQQQHQSRSTHRSANRVRRSASSSDLQADILQLKESAQKLAIRGGSVESVTVSSNHGGSVESVTGAAGSDTDSVVGKSDEYTDSVTSEESGAYQDSIGGDSGLADDEYSDEEDMDHPRGIKRHPDQRGRSPTQKRPRSEERNSGLTSKGSWHFPHDFTPDDHQKLSDTILDFYEKQEQAQDLYVKKMKLRDALYSVMRGVFPYCGLYVVGSSMNGFGSHTSDMDLCLMLSYSEIDQKKEAMEILRMLDKSLKKCSFLKEINLICAKVPILKFRDKISDVECDLNINNSVGIRNTHLLNAYSKLDWRVSCLVLFVKHWAKLQKINDASQGTISSYSLVLMVIHYLQCGCSPPVVPSLQQKYPHKFSASTDIRLLTLNEKLPPYSSPNKECLGELFIGFLHYYAEKFDFSKFAISVRLGQRIARNVVMSQNPIINPPSQWKFLCIEEPFNLSNTARSVFDEVTFQHIRSVIQKSYRKLRLTKDVGSILDHQL